MTNERKIEILKETFNQLELGSSGICTALSWVSTCDDEAFVLKQEFYNRRDIAIQLFGACKWREYWWDPSELNTGRLAFLEHWIKELEETNTQINMKTEIKSAFKKALQWFIN